MTNLKERHLFPGSNSSVGFYSLFDNILPLEDANRIICLKGGPGTGKSSLMKKIGAHFKNKGYTVEYFHCSSDDDSLDVVLVKELKVAVLDGTSPHMIDPVYPGAIDEVINMAEALDYDKLEKNKKGIIEVSTTISNYFKRAYRFLAAAKPIHEDWCKLNSKAISPCKLATITSSLKDAIFTGHKSGCGNGRHLFSTAYTPNGVISFAKDLSEAFNNKYVLKGGPGLGKSDILKEIGETAENKGYFVEYMHNPFIPEKIEHIFIPELSACVLTENEVSQLSFDGKVYDLEKFCDANVLTSIKDDVEYNSNLFYDLTKKAISFIEKAHIIHDDLEAYYVDAMDFNIANTLYDKIVKILEKYE